MKNNKKEIYAAHGIEFKNGRILAPVFGWIAPLLVNGNAKLGEGIFTWSMLPTNDTFTVEIDGKVYAIKGTCPCHCPGCYATKGFYNMPSTIKANAVKTILARDYLDFVARAIAAQVEADKIEAVRIHASGDFFGDEYAAMWRKIAESFPAVKMWTYTKARKYESLFDGLKNANIVKSVIPGSGFNFGHCDYILDTFAKLKKSGASVHICKCGFDKSQHCNKCKGCSENEYVLFVEHSTEYKAEKDAAFPALREIVENQPVNA